jgi:hypothetical protein
VHQRPHQISGTNHNRAVVEINVTPQFVKAFTVSRMRRVFGPAEHSQVLDGLACFKGDHERGVLCQQTIRTIGEVGDYPTPVYVDPDLSGRFEFHLPPVFDTRFHLGVDPLVRALSGAGIPVVGEPPSEPVGFADVDRLG